MRIERHVFGSISGYTTLAQSGGLSHIQRRMLETFAFGQTTDPRYLSSLAQNPAYISRPLGPKHRAITRVLQGNPDDKGRVTLVFVSAVLAVNDWGRTLKGDVWPLLRSAALWQWDGQPTMKHVDLPVAANDPLTLTPDVARYVLGILSELERHDAGGKALLLDGSRFESTIVRTIDMLIPDSIKAAFSSGARSLSANLDVRLNCFARGANVRGSGAGAILYTPSTDGSLQPYATALAGAGLQNGTIPWDLIKSYKGYGVLSEPDHAIALDAGLALGAVHRARLVKKKMSTPAKVALAFGIFLLAAVTVIAIGLYSKGRVAEGRDALADKAKALALVSVTEFARESKTEQQKILQDAADTLEAAKKQEQFPQDVRDDLAAWIRRQEKLREAIDKKKEQLKELKEALDHPFPNQAEKQLPPSVVQRLREAVKAARGPVSELAVDITHACRDELRNLTDRADEVERELKRRERRYRAFVLRAQRADRNAQMKPAQDVRKQIENTWAECAAPDPRKKQIIDTLYRQLSNLADRPNRQKATQDRLLNSIQQVAKALKRDELIKVRPTFEAALKEAKRYPALEPLIEKADRTAAAADGRTADKKPSAEDEKIKKIKQKWDLTLEIGKKIAAAAKLKKPTKDKPARDKKIKEIRAVIKRLEPLDKLYAEALGKLVTALDQWRSRLPRKPEPKVIEKRLRLSWDLSWKRLVNAGGDLNEADEYLKKIREVVAKKRVPPPKHRKNQPPILSPEDVQKRRMLGELKGWMDLFRKHVKDVEAVANENKL